MTLESGRWYVATRPIATSRNMKFTVTIWDDEGNPVIEYTGLSYNEANDFINAFNNDDFSFYGRIW